MDAEFDHKTLSFTYDVESFSLWIMTILLCFGSKLRLFYWLN